MRTLNKKLITASIFVLIVILILSNLAYAKPFTDAFGGGLTQVNNFFTGEQYKPYAKAIDFFFFSLLFIAVYMIGARYAFKEVKRPEQVIVILLGLMSAFLLVLGGFSATILLPYIHWLLYTLLFILYWWLLKGIKSKFWRFVLALLLTLLTIGLIQGLFDSLTAPDAEGFFKSLGRSFGGIKFPEIGWPGVPDYLQNLFGAPTPTITGPSLTTLPPAPAPTASEERGFPWWGWLLIALALAAGGLGALALWKRKKKPAAPETTTPEEEGQMTLSQIISDIVDVFNRKKKILKALKEIIAKKKALAEAIHDLYWKGIQQFEQPFWSDPDSPAFEKFKKEHGAAGEILELEIKLEKELAELMKIEDELMGKPSAGGGHIIRKGKGWKWVTTIIKQSKTRSDELYNEFVKYEKQTPLLFWEKVKAAMQENSRWFRDDPEWFRNTVKSAVENISLLFWAEGLCKEVKRMISYYFLIAEDDRRRDEVWKKLTNPDKLFEWTHNRDRWKKIAKEYGPTTIKTHFEAEERFFMEKFRPALLIQMKHLYLLAGHLKFMYTERKNDTVMQEIWIEYPDASGTIVKLTKEQAADQQNAIPEGTTISFVTRLQTGIGPFRAACYLDGYPARNQTGTIIVKDIARTDTEHHPVIQFKTNEFSNPIADGEHDLKIILVGKAPDQNAPTKSPTSYTQTLRVMRDIKDIRFWIAPSGVPQRKIVTRPFDDPWKTKDPRLPIDIDYIPISAPGKEIDLSPWFSPVRDQDDLKACSAFSVGSIYEFLHNYINGNKTESGLDVSELFLYYEARKSHTPPETELNVGTKRSIVCQILKDRGTCLEQFWSFEPEQTGKYKLEPSPEAYADAENQKILQHFVLPVNKELIIRTLFDYKPVVISVFVRNSLFSVRSKYYQFSIQESPLNGVHTLVIVGYDSQFQTGIGEGVVEAFKIRNSWGTGWGENGYTWIRADKLMALIAERGDPPRLIGDIVLPSVPPIILEPHLAQPHLFEPHSLTPHIPEPHYGPVREEPVHIGEPHVEESHGEQLDLFEPHYGPVHEEPVHIGEPHVEEPHETPEPHDAQLGLFEPEPGLEEVHGQMEYLDRVLGRKRKGRKGTQRRRDEESARANMILKRQDAIARNARIKNAKKHLRR